MYKKTNTLNKTDKIMLIRKAIGVRQHRASYFTVDELKKILTDLNMTSYDFINNMKWNRRDQVDNRWFNSHDINLLWSRLEEKQKPEKPSLPPKPTRLVPPSTESFGVVDIGLTQGKTNVASIFNMLPAALTENAEHVEIRKREDDGKNLWRVEITFYRE